MREGWSGDDYLILFEDEAPSITANYQIANFLPGFEIIGLRGWDDFIVRDSTGRTYTVPTVPLVAEYVSPYVVPTSSLGRDERYTGKIKWYIKPIAFSGDTNPGENITWITHEQHAELVRWWNARYRDLSKRPTPTR